MSHTKGPWRTVDGWIYPADYVDRVGSNKYEAAIAKAYGVSDTAAANARLIAASPELLQALENIAGHTSNAIVRNKQERPTSLLDLHSTVLSVQVMARNAIAKAKGEAS